MKPFIVGHLAHLGLARYAQRASIQGAVANGSAVFVVES
jgi:hypothetical protein